MPVLHHKMGIPSLKKANNGHLRQSYVDPLKKLCLTFFNINCANEIELYARFRNLSLKIRLFTVFTVKHLETGKENILILHKDQ